MIRPDAPLPTNPVDAYTAGVRAGLTYAVIYHRLRGEVAHADAIARQRDAMFPAPGVKGG